MIPILFAILAIIASILYFTNVLMMSWWVIVVLGALSAATYIIPSILIRKSSEWDTISTLIEEGKKEAAEKRTAKKQKVKEKRQRIIDAIKRFFRKEERVDEEAE